ncbi:MAG: TetR/AcrR family transcriptional regulator [Alphaproteobacteria bacterium]
MARRSDHSHEELNALILDAARGVLEKEGLAGLTTRRIGQAIGYSPGTLYNRFKDLDDIVVNVNAATLDELYAELAAVAAGGDAAATLRALVARYLDFTTRRPKLWALLFQTSPDAAPRPDWYYAKMGRLFSLVEAALAPLFGTGREQERRDMARLLWAGLHGLCTLAAEGAVLTWDDVRRLSDLLIATTIAGLRHPVRSGDSPSRSPRRADTPSATNASPTAIQE